MRTFTINVFLVCFLYAPLLIPANALTIDTTLIGKNSPGPYSLGWHFVDTSSIIINFQDSTYGVIPPYTYLENVNGILFSEPIDSGVLIALHYSTDFYGVKKIYSLYPKKTIQPGDTLNSKQLTKLETAPFFTNDNINISGYKSVGISLGNQGQMDLEQALEVRISGNINENTELSANLSDQGASLQGDTREIGEIDKMFVTLKNPLYSVTVGDMYMSMPAGGLIEGHKKIKGISAGYTGKQLHASFATAISGGKFTVQNIRGQLGFQGPYYLTGNGESDIITPISGTIRVVVNDKTLQEGEGRDYVVNYDIASIRFTPSFPISNNSLIQVYYEYKSFDYQRIFLSNLIGVNSKDSSISLSGVIWFESDNKEHSLDITLDDTVLTILKKTGDNIPLVTTGRKIDEFDVPEQNTISRIYQVTSTGTKSIYYYSPYNPSKPDSARGYYIVWFSQVWQGLGNYKQYTKLDSLLIYSVIDPETQIIDKNALINCSPAQCAVIYSLSADSIHIDINRYHTLNLTLMENDTRGPVYIYVGEGNGSYTALSSAPTPQRTISGELSASFKPQEWLNIKVNIAGEEKDKNLFSKVDDDDNTASALRSSFQLGRNVFDEKCFWIQGSHTFSSHRFSKDILSRYEKINFWDREFFKTNFNELNTWQVSTGATLFPNVSTDISYGQLIRNDSLKTHRMTYETNSSPSSNVLFSYSGMFIKHFDLLETEKLHKDNVKLLLDYSPLAYSLTIDDEWYTCRNIKNRGKIGLGLDIKYIPLSFSESFYYAQARTGGTSIFSPFEKLSNDTGHTFIWTQSISHSPRSEWKYYGSSSYHFEKKTENENNSSTISVLLITLSNDVASVKTGFSTHQEYRLSSEKASFYTPIFIPVDTLEGTHYYDSLTGDYKQGYPYNWKLLEEQEVYDTTGTDRIRKSTLRVNWYYKPYLKKIKGILADLTWSGSLSLDEHISSDLSQSLQSWIPGYNSITGQEDPSIVFTNIYYRQDLNYHSSQLKGLYANIFLEPVLRKNRSYNESGFIIGGKIEQNLKKFFLGIDGKYQTINRSNRSGFDTTTITDRNITLSQRYYFVPSFSVFSNETIGGAEKKQPIVSPTGAVDSLTQGPYFKLQPGLTLRIPGKGWAELSYTWSNVIFNDFLEYPMAQGLRSGISHSIDFVIDFSVGDHFTIGASYRGDYNDNRYNDSINKEKIKMLHLVSMEIKAFL